jgi:hypothetical protein
VTEKGLYLVWLLFALAAVAVVFCCGSEIPYWDDWVLVPVLSGQQPLGVAWLMAPQNEHRLPFSRLLMWIAWRIAGDGNRIILMANVLLLVWAARLLMLTTARLRQGPGWADLLIPVLFLHWGHMENLLWSSQLCAFSAVWLFFAAAAMLGRDVRAWRWPHLALACGSVVLLPLQMAVGVAMTPGCAAALMVAAGELIRSPDARLRRRGAIAALAALVACLVAAALVTAYTPVARHSPVVHDFAPTLRAVLGCAGTSLGVWGRVPLLAGAAVLGLSAFSIGAGVAVWRRRPPDRPLVLRLYLLLLAAWTVAAAIGWGRVRFGATTERYSLLSVPILGCALMLCALYRFPPKGRAWRAAILLAAAAVWAANTLYGGYYAKQRLCGSWAMRRDIADGLPLVEIVGRNWFRWAPSESMFGAGLATLQEQKIIPFRDIAPDPPYELRTIADFANAATGRPRGVELSLAGRTRYDVPLGKPTHVLAIRTRWIVPEGAKWIDYAVEWSGGGPAAVKQSSGGVVYGYLVQEREIVETTWVDAMIDAVAIRLCAESAQPLLALRKAAGQAPAKPTGPFTLAGVELLLPR